VLVQLIRYLLDNKIQHVTCLSPCELLNRILRFCPAFKKRSPSSLIMRSALCREASNYSTSLHVNHIW